MITLQGKYNTAYIYNDHPDQSAISQISTFLEHPVFENGRISIMPDLHAGAGAVIGFTAPLGDKIIPNVIGVDIGCGVSAWQLGELSVDYSQLDHFIRQRIPSGHAVRKNVNHLRFIEELYKSCFDADGTLFPYFNKFIGELKQVCLRQKQDNSRVLQSFGTLGGGNHFIELACDEQHRFWLLIHSGSRNFGLKVATWHQAIAKKKVGDHHGLEWLEGTHAEAYVDDMNIAQLYAALNRRLMGFLIIQEFFKLDFLKLPFIESVHNYINFQDNIIRKGAISAHEGEQVVIPFNMAEGTILGIGRGNQDWNCSAPHGAGRVMSRRAAKNKLDLQRFKKIMKEADVWSSCVSLATLDESPEAYKQSSEIKSLLAESVKTTANLRPVYNFKAS